MRLPRLVIGVAMCLASVRVFAVSPPEVTLTRADDRVRVEIGGQLLTEYIFKGAYRPYCYPVLAADGTPLTRNFPMKQVAGEDPDHPHHRSLWFAHSDVNGVDFWNQDDAGSRRPKGKIVHDALLETTSGAVGVIRARDRWVAPDGKVFCTDDTTIRFAGSGSERTIDFEVTLNAPADAPVELNDNKDGVLALRLAAWLNQPRPPNTNRRFTGGVGQLVTARGDRDGAAWGKRAPWADFHAVHDGRTYGVAIFDHPQNLRHPTWWHARDYGLFAANPLGQHDFEPKSTPVNAGRHTIPAGGSLTLRYRVFLHYGDEKEAKLGERYEEYAAGKRP
ncbi:MAG: PmoA family protein [Opitutaceae bacterium]|nr:PmoA family protein [Opitutaceae bacterium]